MGGAKKLIKNYSKNFKDRFRAKKAAQKNEPEPVKMVEQVPEGEAKVSEVVEEPKVSEVVEEPKVSEIVEEEPKVSEIVEEPKIEEIVVVEAPKEADIAP